MAGGKGRGGPRAWEEGGGRQARKGWEAVGGRGSLRGEEQQRVLRIGEGEEVLATGEPVLRDGLMAGDGTFKDGKLGSTTTTISPAR